MPIGHEEVLLRNMALWGDAQHLPWVSFQYVGYGVWLHSGDKAVA
jgi:hypothetical protein